MAADRSKAGRKRVGLFVTCLVDLFRPEIGFASASLIEKNGFQVEVPRSQTCCGQPLFNSGDFHGFRKIASRFLNVFEEYDYIVAPSGSCAAVARIHYPEQLSGDPKECERARNLASRTFELTDFLTGVADWQVAAAYPGNCTYHDSCSGLRELGIQAQPRKLLDAVEGLNLTECEDSIACCGFGGTFCVKYPQISARIAAEKAQNVERSGADTLLGGDLGCLLNIAGTLSRRGSEIKVRHVAEVLAGEVTGPAIGKPRN